MGENTALREGCNGVLVERRGGEGVKEPPPIPPALPPDVTVGIKGDTLDFP